MVSFVDIPEALTQGETVAEAMEAAKDALLTAFDFFILKITSLSRYLRH